MTNTDLVAQHLLAHASSIGEDFTSLAAQLDIEHPAVVALARVVNEMTDVLEILWDYTSEPLRQPLISFITAKALKETTGKTENKLKSADP